MSAISIVIPCRDAADFLAATLRSAMNQTRLPEEIVVVDDGSTDGSAEVAAGFPAPVRVVAGPARGGAAARRTGADIARGDRLMFLDADDLITPPTLAGLDRALDAVGRPAIAACPWDRLEQAGATWRVRPPSAAPRAPGQDALAGWLTGAWSPPAALLWDRAAYEASGGWDLELQVDIDGELVRRALARGIPLRRTDEGLALYRRAPEGTVSVSGRRLSTTGLHSRLKALQKTRDELVRADRLERYARPLGVALDELARDAGDVGSVADAARALAADLGPGRGRWRVPVSHRRLARIAARLCDIARAPRPRRAPNVIEPPIARSKGVATAPLVSVIVPTFNRAALVGRAVASVLDQSHRSLELIVVDDGSTDDTATRLQAIDDPRLCVIRQANGGVARARNRGLAQAQGAYVAFLDSDDYWLPAKLEQQIAALEVQPPRVGFCHTALEIRSASRLIETRPATAQGPVFEQLLLWNHVHAPTSTGLVRREVIEAVGGFDPELPAIEDWEWLQRVARLYDLLAIDVPLAVYCDDDDPLDQRRSLRFRANMAAREMLWQRNRHALRRAGIAHLYLIESARRELRHPRGDGRRATKLVARALAERPQSWRHWPWLAYPAAPRPLRRWLGRQGAGHPSQRWRMQRA